MARRLISHPLGRAVALLLVAAGLLAGSFAHVGELHSQRFGPEQEVFSGCSAHHPPSFEPRLSSRNVECPACLLQLQQHAAAPTLAPITAPMVVARVGNAAPGAPHSRAASRLAPPRGPPAAA